MNFLRVEAGVSRYSPVRRKRQEHARVLKRAGFALAFALAIFVGVGLAFAGSGGQMADGVKIDGVDVGGLTPSEAEKKLRHIAAQLAGRPLAVHAGRRTFRISPSQLGVDPDWHSAVAAAAAKGDGFGPFRGFRRLYLRISPPEIAPRPRASATSVDAWLAWVARHVDRPRRDAVLKLRGLQPVIIPARMGRVLDRKAAGRLVVASLTSFERKP